MIKTQASLLDMDGFDAQLSEVIAAIHGKEDEVATFIEERAKSSAKFIDRSGNLRESIRKQRSKFEDGGFIVKASGKGKDKGYHAANVEFGHVMVAWGRITGERVAARPFMRNALEDGLRKAVDVFRSDK